MGSCGIISKQSCRNFKQKKQTWNNETVLPDFICINEVMPPTACATLNAWHASAETRESAFNAMELFCGYA